MPPMAYKVLRTLDPHAIYIKWLLFLYKYWHVYNVCTYGENHIHRYKTLNA